MNTAKLKAAAEKAKDDFLPNVTISTRDVLELIAALEAATARIAELEEQKAKWVSWAEQAAGEVDKARQRIAELEVRERAEPVYQCMDDGKWYDTEKRLYDEVKENGNECRVLYTAPPAPVVPEEWEPCSPEWIERNGPCSCAEAPRIAFGPIGNHYHPHLWHKPTPPAPSHENVHYADAAEVEIAALRKRIAELETAPPAPVVAGWIACSERMPENGQMVLAANVNIHTYEAALFCIGNVSDVGYFGASNGKFTATHWVPLPAAPGNN